MKKDRFAKPRPDPRKNRGQGFNREAFDKGWKHIKFDKKEKTDDK